MEGCVCAGLKLSTMEGRVCAGLKHSTMEGVCVLVSNSGPWRAVCVLVSNTAPWRVCVCWSQTQHHGGCVCAGLKLSTMEGRVCAGLKHSTMEGVCVLVSNTAPWRVCVRWSQTQHHGGPCVCWSQTLHHGGCVCAGLKLSTMEGVW